MSTDPPDRRDDPFGRGEESGSPEDAFGAREGQVTSGDPLAGDPAPAGPPGGERPAGQPAPGGWQPPSGAGQWEAPPSSGGQWGAPTQPHWGSAPPGNQDTNGKAITALVLGIGGFLVCPIILSIAAIVLGNQARGEIRASQGRQKGEGMAKAGVILGIVSLVLTALFIVLIVILGVVGSETSGGDSGSGETATDADPLNVITFTNDALVALGSLL